MPSANVKLGVEYAQFKRGMNEANESVKTLTTALKANESQLELTGDKELYLKNKVELLKQQIEAQKQAVVNAMNALKDLDSRGIEPASKEYQTMQRNLNNATDKLNKMQISLRDVETGTGDAKNGAQQMNTELKRIGHGVSWENITSGLNSVINKLESGARAAISFGKKIVNSAKGSTGWADELMTLSQQTGIDTTRLQQMQKVAEFIDTDVDAIITARDRMARATQTEKGVESIEEVLGIQLTGQSADDLFWEIGEALAGMGEEFDKETAAQKIFGRSWRELLPLFKAGREEYERMLEEQTTLSEDDVKKLVEADDAIKGIEQEWQQMKNQFWADNADKITELMQWLMDNKESVVAAITAIGGAFGALKLASLGADMMKLVNGFKELKLLGGAGQAAAAGSGATAAAAGGGAATLAAGGPLATKLATLMTSNAGIASIAALLGFPMFDKVINGDMRTADEIEKDIMRTIGGQNVVDIYEKIQQQGLARRKVENPDWRPSYMQDQSYYGGPGKGSETVQTGAHGRGVSTFDNYSASLDRMASEAAETSANTQRIAQNSVTSADIQTLTGLPAAVAQAVTAGMKTVTIVIGASAVDAIGTRVGGNMANQVLALTK